MRKKRKQLDFVVAAIQHRRTTVRIAVLGVVHQAPPTAKGFHFITLEDEAGLIDVIVNPQIYARYRPLWQSESLLIVDGTMHSKGRSQPAGPSSGSNAQPVLTSFDYLLFTGVDL